MKSNPNSSLIHLPHTKSYNHLILSLFKDSLYSVNMEMRTNFTITLFHLIKSNSETKLIRVKKKKSTHKNLSILNFHNQLFFGRESSIKTNELQIVLGVVSGAP